MIKVIQTKFVSFFFFRTNNVLNPHTKKNRLNVKTEQQKKQQTKPNTIDNEMEKKEEEEVERKIPWPTRTLHLHTRKQWPYANEAALDRT